MDAYKFFWLSKVSTFLQSQDEIDFFFSVKAKGAVPL